MLRVCPKRLRDSVRFDPQTGLFRFRSRPAGHFARRRDCNAWNARFADAPAFASLSSGGYLYGYFESTQILAHRAAWVCTYGDWPAGLIDHINGNRSDNRILNLRTVDAQGNAKNRGVFSARSGHRGVSKSRWGDKWVAQIWHDGKGKHLGTFNTLDEAVAARIDAERSLGFCHRSQGVVI